MQELIRGLLDGIAPEQSASPLPSLIFYPSGLVLSHKVSRREPGQRRRRRPRLRPTKLQRAAHDPSGHLYEAWKRGFNVAWPKHLLLGRQPSAFRPRNSPFPQNTSKGSFPASSTPFEPPPSSRTPSPSPQVPAKPVKIKTLEQQQLPSGFPFPIHNATSQPLFSLSCPQSPIRSSKSSFTESYPFLPFRPQSQPALLRVQLRVQHRQNPSRYPFRAHGHKSAQPSYPEYHPLHKSPPLHLHNELVQTTTSTPLLGSPIKITTNMNDHNATQQSGGRGSAPTSISRRSTSFVPPTPSRRSREGRFVSLDAFDAKRLQRYLIDEPGKNPYTQRLDSNWSYVQLRSRFGSRAFNDILAEKLPMTTDWCDYLRSLAYTSTSGIQGISRFAGLQDEFRMDTHHGDHAAVNAMYDPFVDENCENIEARPSEVQGFNSFDHSFDQQQQYDVCQQNQYNQQSAYQQQPGYCPGPYYNQQPAYDTPSFFEPTITSMTRVPPRLPYKAVRGTQADTALNRTVRASTVQQKGLPVPLNSFLGMSKPMQAAYIESKGLASPHGSTFPLTNIADDQLRDEVPYTGYVQREFIEDTVKEQRASANSTGTVLYDRAWQTSNTASTIDSKSTAGGQLRQLHTPQQSSIMTKSETEKSIMDGFLREARAAQAPIPPTRTSQQPMEFSGPQFEVFAEATRRTAGGNSLLQNEALAKVHYDEIMSSMPCDETGRPLYDEYPPPDLSQGQSFTPDGESTTDGRKDLPKNLKAADEWFEKPTKDAKEAALLREYEERQNVARNRSELGQGSEALSTIFTTPTKDSHGLKPYMSPIGTDRPRARRSACQSAFESATVTALQHMKDYKETAQTNGSDGFTKFGQPPAHATDYSANGNKSLFGSEWNPPARVGRDPRHQTTMHDGRPTLFMEPQSASGSDGRAGRPF